MACGLWIDSVGGKQLTWCGRVVGYVTRGYQSPWLWLYEPMTGDPDPSSGVADTCEEAMRAVDAACRADKARSIMR
jgi:hypothetical protein